MQNKHNPESSGWKKTTFLSLFQADWCLRLPDRAEMRRSAGRWCGERLTHIGWLLITTVLLSMLKHIGSRWAGSLWLSKREGGCCGRESEGERATETPPRGGVRTAEVDPGKAFPAKTPASSAQSRACVPTWKTSLKHFYVRGRTC